MEHSNVVKVRAQWQLENLPRRHPGIDGDDYADNDVDGDDKNDGDCDDVGEIPPVFDLHGPLVKDEHWACRDDEQDRDKLEMSFQEKNQIPNLKSTKYQI